MTNMLKSIFTRENSNPGNCEKGTNQSQGVGMGSSFGRLNQSQSTASLNRNSGVAGGTVKITDQVIEEVDEQLTVTSIPPRPSTERVHVKNIFPESKNCHSSSDPVEVPLVSFDNNERPVNISTSAPTHPFSDAWETLTSTGGKTDNLVIANHTVRKIFRRLTYARETNIIEFIIIIIIF